jgi:hypothetical protein
LSSPNRTFPVWDSSTVMRPTRTVSAVMLPSLLRSLPGHRRRTLVPPQELIARMAQLASVASPKPVPTLPAPCPLRAASSMDRAGQWRPADQLDRIGRELDGLFTATSRHELDELTVSAVWHRLAGGRAAWRQRQPWKEG